MSWDDTYSHTFVIALDRFFAAILFNQPDVTISSLCWIVLNANYNDVANKALRFLKLSKIQAWFLMRIGKFLEKFWPGHCFRANQEDTNISIRTHFLLQGK